MVCTPCHSDVTMHYTQAVLKFQQECLQRNILVSFTLLKSSLVTQGRNLCAAEMLNHKDKYTHLLFIDSDIDFKFSTIEKMLKADLDVIACPYPMKMMDWNKIWRRVNNKEDAITSAEDMARSGFTYPIKVEDQYNIIAEKGIIEVTHAPTGCMLIKRHVIQDMIDNHPELEIYQPTYINGKEEKKDNFFNLFDTWHDVKTKRYFGEDFGFCQKWRDMGGKVHIYVMDTITHVGEFLYRGRFFDDLYQGTRPAKLAKPLDEDTKIK
jgi:NDP-sugar pyrophosphorylase family protein